MIIEIQTSHFWALISWFRKYFNLLPHQLNLIFEECCETENFKVWINKTNRKENQFLSASNFKEIKAFYIKSIARYFST